MDDELREELMANISLKVHAILKDHEGDKIPYSDKSWCNPEITERIGESVRKYLEELHSEH